MKPNSQFIYQRQLGLTLVELLIAMTIGLFIVGAISTLYIKTRSGFSYLEEVARIQETGRFAMEAISRDIRMAGYTGCGRNVTNVANVVTGGIGDPFMNIATPVRGYGDGLAFPSAISDAGAIAGTDAIILIGADPSSELVVKSHDPVAARINTSAHSIQQGEILLVTNCSKASMLQVSGPNNASNNATYIEHSNSGSPGNCTKFLGASCGSPAGSYTFKAGSSLLKVYSNAYYIANSQQVDGTRSLWSITLEGNTTGSGTSRELLPGVDDMQVAYGLDIDGNGSADQYVTANAVQSGNNWSRVVSVRISLLVASKSKTIATGTQSYIFPKTSGSTDDATVTPADGVLRKVFSETVAVRNRVM